MHCFINDNITLSVHYHKNCRSSRFSKELVSDISGEDAIASLMFLFEDWYCTLWYNDQAGIGMHSNQEHSLKEIAKEIAWVLPGKLLHGAMKTLSNYAKYGILAKCTNRDGTETSAHFKCTDFLGVWCFTNTVIRVFSDMILTSLYVTNWYNLVNI